MKLVGSYYSYHMCRCSSSDVRPHLQNKNNYVQIKARQPTATS